EKRLVLFVHHANHTGGIARHGDFHGRFEELFFTHLQSRISRSFRVDVARAPRGGSNHTPLPPRKLRCVRTSAPSEPSLARSRVRKRPPPHAFSGQFSWANRADPAQVGAQRRHTPPSPQSSRDR